MSRIGCLPHIWGVLLTLTALLIAFLGFPIWLMIAEDLPRVDLAEVGEATVQMVGLASPVPILAMVLAWLLSRGDGFTVSMKTWVKLVVLYVILGQGAGLVISSVVFDHWRTPAGILMIVCGVAVGVGAFYLDSMIERHERRKVVRVMGQGPASRHAVVPVEILASEISGRSNCLTLVAWETPAYGRHRACVLTTDTLYNWDQNVALVAMDRPDRLVSLVSMGGRRSEDAKAARSR